MDNGGRMKAATMKMKANMATYLSMAMAMAKKVD